MQFDAVTDRVLINGSQQHMDAVRRQLRAEAAAKADAQEHKKRKRQQQQQQAQPQEPVKLLQHAT
jgi:hypothetical protein